MTKTSFIGGSLSFKGDKKKSKKKKKTKTKHKLRDEGHAVEETINQNPLSGSDVDDDELTSAERKALKFKRLREREENKKIAQKSHRERVEALNDKLGSMTELNDIPRVSAAGNG